MRDYEILVLTDPDAEEAQLNEVVKRITEIVTSGGGEITKVDRWGRRKLAYQINRKGEGDYTLILFRSEPPALTELDRVLSLADEVLRFKIGRQAA